MRSLRSSLLLAVVFSVLLHAVVLALAGNYRFSLSGKSPPPEAVEVVTGVGVVPPPPTRALPVPAYPAILGPLPAASTAPAKTVLPDRTVTAAAAGRQPASMPAPPAPTAEEWAFAARYTRRNSKGYRYSWGQQVRSLMGTAIEGPDQGLVRFRVEIAPDGSLSKLELLWSTSALAEQRARRAIESMPRLPATPTGKPLRFERTISFTPFASEGPPIYRDDCLPEPPSFRNPFAWDGRSPQVPTEPEPVEKLDPQAVEECLRQLPQDSIEAEGAHDQRQLEQWGSDKLGR